MRPDPLLEQGMIRFMSAAGSACLPRTSAAAGAEGTASLVGRLLLVLQHTRNSCM